MAFSYEENNYKSFLFPSFISDLIFELSDSIASGEFTFIISLWSSG